MTDDRSASPERKAAVAKEGDPGLLALRCSACGASYWRLKIETPLTYPDSEGVVCWSCFFRAMLGESCDLIVINDDRSSSNAPFQIAGRSARSMQWCYLTSTGTIEYVPEGHVFTWWNIKKE
jgi:hypothetical protein